MFCFCFWHSFENPVPPSRKIYPRPNSFEISVLFPDPCLFLSFISSVKIYNFFLNRCAVFRGFFVQLQAGAMQPPSEEDTVSCLGVSGSALSTSPRGHPGTTGNLWLGVEGGDI